MDAATQDKSFKEKDTEVGIEKPRASSEATQSEHIRDSDGIVMSGERVEGVERGLKSRHMSMIAIGGVLGSGLFIGTGKALATGGPLGILLGYIIMGAVVYSVMVGAGEMASIYPLSGGFVLFATRFLDPAMGFALGWNYWYQLAITIPAEVSAGYILIEYWDTSKFPIYAWIVLYLGCLSVVNLAPVRYYGEVEFWFAILKVFTIIGLILTLLIIDLGGVSGQERIGFRYWKNPGALPQLNGIEGSLGRFLSFWTVFLQAAFSFLCTEVVVLVAAEAQNPRVTIPRATKSVFYRILIFYLGGVLVIGMCVPYDDPKLLSDAGDASASPFVIAIQNAGISVLPAIVNASILLATFSAGNSFVYACSRSLYGLALDQQAPKIFLKTWNHIPYVAVIFSLSFGLLSFMTVSSGASVVFNWFYTLSSISGIMAWVVILASYLRFRAACFKQGVDRSKFPYQAPFQPYLSWFGMFFLTLVVFFNGFQVFLSGGWDVSSFVSAYISIPIFFVFYVPYKFIKKTRYVRLDEMDLSGRNEYEIGEREDEKAARQAELRGKTGFVKRLIHGVATSLGFT